MNRHILLFPFILSCMILLVSNGLAIDSVFSSHDNEEITVYEFGEDLVSEESICNSCIFTKHSATKKQHPVRCSGKLQIQYKDVETPPPEALIC